MSMYSDSDSGAAGWLVGAVRNNPEGLLLLAAGCALLMRSTGASKSRRSRDAREYGRHMTQSGREARDRTVGERISDTAKSAGEYVSDIGESVVETASSYASSVSGYADDVARTAAEQTGRFAQQAKSGIGDTISRVVQEQPLTVALVGAAAGAAVAAAFPASDLENRTLGPTGERLRDAAGRAGEQLKDAATKAGHRLAAAADERGLNTEGLKEVARDVGETFSNALEGEEATQKSQSKYQTSKISPSATTQRHSRKGGSN
jgi:gas vesicle protein